MIPDLNIADDGFKKFDDFPLDWTLKSRAIFSATEVS